MCTSVIVFLQTSIYSDESGVVYMPERFVCRDVCKVYRDVTVCVCVCVNTRLYNFAT